MKQNSKKEDNTTCEQCCNCEYLEQGDMACSKKNYDLVYEDFIPTENYMWCEGKKFEER